MGESDATAQWMLSCVYQNVNARTRLVVNRLAAATLPLPFACCDCPQTRLATECRRLEQNKPVVPEVEDEEHQVVMTQLQSIHQEIVDWQRELEVAQDALDIAEKVGGCVGGLTKAEPPALHGRVASPLLYRTCRPLSKPRRLRNTLPSTTGGKRRE